MASDSPFRHVLNTNYSPTDAEVEEINAYLAIPEREVATIDDEIKEHQAIIDNLAKKRTQSQENIDSHRALLSPIRRLSTELLQQIFAWCLPTTRNPMMHHTDSPLLLGRVCSRWRSVAFGTPELWTRIHIVVPSTDNSSLSRPRRAAVRAWLGRAGSSLPLNISLYSHFPVGELELMLCEVIGFCHQWHTISMDIPEIGTLNLCSMISGNVPMLKNAKFKLVAGSSNHRHRSSPWRRSPMQEHGDNELESLLRFVLTNPSLEQFDLRVEPTVGWFSELRLPPRAIQKSLKSLSIDFHDSFNTHNPAEQILNLLSVLPNLKRCNLSCSQSMPPPPAIPIGGVAHIPSARENPILLQSLEALTIRVSNSYLRSQDTATSVFKDILDKLYTPALVEVDFGVQNDDAPSFLSIFASLMRLLSRSSTTLSKLCIRRDDRVLKQVLKQCLVQCPDLHELVVERMDTYMWGRPRTPDDDDDEDGDGDGEDIKPPIGDTILELLANDSSMCPKLTSMSLFRFASPQLHHKTLVDFLRRRRRMGIPLKEFSLQPAMRRSSWDPSWNNRFKPVKEDPEYDTEFLDQIEELKTADGLQVTLGDHQTTNAWTRSSPWIGFDDPIDD